MVISLVVCTRNRARQLRAGLESLVALHAAFEWQLVVVDNASTDETPRVLEEFRSRFPHSFKCVTETTPGTGAARDRGWRTATGDIVAYIDDDCYPAEDYLSSMVEVFRENPEVGVVAGRILLFDPTDYEITVRTETSSEEYAPGAFIDAGLFQTANCAFRRSALEAVDGFDERFGPGALRLRGRRCRCQDLGRGLAGEI
jgi:glycosyltransferase involved in cell wall biosynthesis